MFCEVCGKDAPFFTETYCPKMGKPRTIWLCKDHQDSLFLDIGRSVCLMTLAEKDKKNTVAYGIGNTPTFIPPNPINYIVNIADLNKGDKD